MEDAVSTLSPAEISRFGTRSSYFLILTECSVPTDVLSLPFVHIRHFNLETHIFKDVSELVMIEPQVQTTSLTSMEAWNFKIRTWRIRHFKAVR